MQTTQTVQETRAALASLRSGGKRLALVPTMGFLHEGHLSLIRRAKAEADVVAVSIFVNPTQFGDPADLEKYPRDTERDLALLKAEGVDLVFMPEVADVYFEDSETIVETTRLANMMHGAVRPGHFRGVTTVVTMLFNIIQPDVAVFGEKDFQQLAVIRRMVRDLHIPVEIIGGRTCREADGLAMSSRNVRLTPEDRAAAVVLNRALDMAERLVRDGVTASALKAAVAAHIEAEPRATLRAVDICDPDSLAELSGPVTGPAALMISAEFGGILLIDQRVATP
ncbi:Pantothenate synthetase [Pseudoruegeria aquimaris]|uniref:Pantothenate synthetase n=1 Tax=Pseudoruegeria aquimaris TaxID=393663 RepID=A0A1Y5SUD2_9RHOB|nr:pantoate--beta-alanine ligase [Pseudoruegeria aquimaris]SLN45279.1 Pantothenate synthetase [Pseudoruegeria aquimaris]